MGFLFPPTTDFISRIIVKYFYRDSPYFDNFDYQLFCNKRAEIRQKFCSPNCWKFHAVLIVFAIVRVFS